MEESAVKRMAILEVIRYSINNSAPLLDKQAELTAMELKEGIKSAAKGAGLLILGVGGVGLMVIALAITAIMGLALLTARIAFFVMAKGYGAVKALEGRVQGRPVASYAEDGDSREAA